MVSSRIVRSAANEKSKTLSKPTLRIIPAMNALASAGSMPYSAAITERTAGATKPTTTVFGSLIAVNTSPRSRT